MHFKFSYNKKQIIQGLRYHFISRREIKLMMILVNVFAIGSAVLFYTKKIRPEPFLLGSFIIIPIGFHDFTQIHWELFNWTHWTALAFVVFGATFASYLLIVYAIGKLGAPKVGTYIYTQPVFATITSMVLSHEQLTPIKIIAAFFIFGGVFMVNKKSKE